MIHVKGRRVLVKPDSVEMKTKAGIIIAADKMTEKIEQSGQMYGTLVAIGSVAWEDYPEPFAEIGDFVLYSQYAGRVVHDPIDHEGYVVMNDEDIIATLDRPDNDEVTTEDVLVSLDARRESLTV
jgi:co-chaperonin GroES (HSP10)